jgi:hypothetical protein
MGEWACPTPPARDGVAGRARGGAGLQVDGEVGLGEPPAGDHRRRGGGEELDLPSGHFLSDGAAAVGGVGHDLGDRDRVGVKEPGKDRTIGRRRNRGLRRGDEVGVEVHRQVHLVAVVAGCRWLPDSTSFELASLSDKPSKPKAPRRRLTSLCASY